jgi:HSP20 family protein
MSDSHESNPFLHQAEKFRGEVERLVERLKDQGERALDSIGVRPFGVWHPAADIVETPEQVIVALDVPGVMGESLDVQIAGNMLTISGSRPALDAAAGNVVHSQDRPVGEFARSFPMPVAVDHNKVEAEVTDGVLTVRLAKAAQARSHSIPVGSKPKTVTE